MKEGRSFWKWFILWSRAYAMAEAREKRIMRENLETWNRENRAFIEKCNREVDREIDKQLNRTSYLGCNLMDGSGQKYYHDD